MKPEKENLIEFLFKSNCFSFDAAGCLSTEHIGNEVHKLDLENLFVNADVDERNNFYKVIAEDLCSKIHNFQFLVGIPITGAIIASHIARYAGKKFLAFGSEGNDEKDLTNKIEIIKNSSKNAKKIERVVLFDDVSASGQSLIEAALFFLENDINVAGAYTIYDKMLSAEEKLKEVNVKLYSYFTIQDMIKNGVKKNILSQEMVSKIKEYWKRKRKFLHKIDIVDNVRKPIFKDNYLEYKHVPLDVLNYYALGVYSEKDMLKYKKHMNNCSRCQNNYKSFLIHTQKAIAPKY